MTSQGSQLYYRSLGSGEPIIIIHGGPGFDHLYLFDGFKFLAKNYRVIFYDQRGSGQSSPKVDASLISMSSFVNDLENLRKELGLGKINLIGHSFGGLLAMNYAIHYPKRVSKMVLVSTAPGSSDFYPDFRKRLRVRTNKSDSLEIIRLASLPEYKARNPNMIKKYFALFFKAYYFNKALAVDMLPMTTNSAFNAHEINQLMGKSYLQSYSIYDQLKLLETPTMIVHGEDDPIPLKSVRRVHDALPNSQIKVLDKCGHMPYVESADDFKRSIIGFLYSDYSFWMK